MSQMSYHHTPLERPLEGRLWHQLLDTKAEQEPDTEAVIFYDMNMKRSTLTYAEYRDRSMHLAASLLQLGLSYGQRALLIGNSGPKYLISIMALHRIGAEAILMGPGDLTADKVDFITAKNLDCRVLAYDAEMIDSQRKQLMTGIKQLVQHNADSGREPQIIVSLNDAVNENHSGKALQELDKQQAKPSLAWDGLVHSYDDLLKHGQSQGLEHLLEAQEKVQIDDTTIVLFTSGSTGEPKGVQLTGHSLVNFISGSPIAKMTKKIKFYLDRPLSWAGGYLYSHVHLLSNITLVHVPNALTISESSNKNIFKIWEEEKCSVFLLSIVLMTKLLKDSMHLKYNLCHTTMFMLGGQHFDLSLVQAIFEVLPDVKITTIYACTESSKICFELIAKDKAIEGVYGKMAVAPGVEIKIIDDANKIVPRGTPGEICTRSSNIFQGYLENPEATRKTKSKTGWLHTGDIGRMNEQGKVEVLGRKSTIIKRLTVKIFPSEIEKVIQQHPLVAEVVVVGIPDERLYEEICACVILRQNDESRDEIARLQVLEDWCEEQWPPRADGLSLKPKYFLAMKKFPITTSGKTFARGVRDKAIKLLGVKKNLEISTTTKCNNY